MRTLKLLALLCVLTVLAACTSMNSTLIAPAGIAGSDHEALVKHYENLAREAKIKLHENKKILESYEARPYYYGRRGQDLQSHTYANIRAYEEALRESLKYADLHRKMAIEQKNNQINKAENDLNRDFTVENSEYPDNKGL